MNLTCGQDKDIKRPIRQCALNRTRSREDELLRFVLDPEKRVLPDIKRKLPGRGVWITASYDDVTEAVGKGTFPRGFKQPVTAGPDLPDLVAKLLKQAALQDLALTNKTGATVSGYDKVENAIKNRRIFILVHAADASDDASGRLNRLGRAVSNAQSRTLNRIDCFTSAELSSALGKWNVNHAAIADSGVGRKFYRSAKRYVDYLGQHLPTKSADHAPVQDKV